MCFCFLFFYTDEKDTLTECYSHIIHRVREMESRYFDARDTRDIERKEWVLQGE